jgi:hypothetical protein
MRLALGLTCSLAAALAMADPPATTPDQISQPDGPSTGADQIGATSKGDAAAGSQITSTRPDAGAPPQATRRTTDTRAAALAGSDRCDTAPGAQPKPDCAQILDRRADELATAPKTAPTEIVSPDASSDALVNGILSGGTGDVVQLPK